MRTKDYDEGFEKGYRASYRMFIDKFITYIRKDFEPENAEEMFYFIEQVLKTEREKIRGEK